MTRAKAKTPAKGSRSSALSPALTRSTKKTKSLQSQIHEMISSPGWTDASAAFFKSPMASPALAKKTTTVQRSSVYRSVEASRVVKTTSRRRTSIYQAASSTSPALTRARRGSYFSKVFNSPATQAPGRRRATMATMEIKSAFSPVRPKPGPRGRKALAAIDFTALRPPSPVSPGSPGSPAESEVTFNMKSVSSPETTSPKARKAVKKSAGKKTKSVRASKSPKEAAKPAAKKSKIPSKAASPAKKADKTKSSTPRRRSKSPAKKPAKQATPKVIAKSPQLAKKTTPKEARVTPTDTKVAAKKKPTPQKRKVTPKVAKVSSKNVTPKVTPKQKSTVKITSETAKALKGSPRVHLEKTPILATKKASIQVSRETPEQGNRIYPKTPMHNQIADSPATPFKTPSGVTPKKHIKSAAKKPITSTKSRSPPKPAAKRSSPTSKTPVKSASSTRVTKKTPSRETKTSTRATGKTPPRAAAKKTPVRSVSSPALSSAKRPLRGPLGGVPTAAILSFDTPPKAARVLGKTPASSKIKSRKLTPSRRVAHHVEEMTIIHTSTPVEQIRKRPAVLPMSEIRSVKKMKGVYGEEITTSISEFTHLEPEDKMAVAKSNWWLSNWCTIL